jgi:O-antigen/teichoic acid export membrane protein
MTNQQSSYRQIFKATSLFGGVQVFNILIAIIRSKIIAVLLGPTGIGINSLLNSTTGFIAGLTNFGLGTSAVKNVAAAHGTGNSRRIATVVIVLRRLVWVTGLLGAVLTMALSPWLSQLTFGNKDYTLAFIWISGTLLLNQISTGQGVVLRGMRKLNYMARSSLSGSVIGLLVSVPIYYKWGIDGIVPAIIVTSIASLLRTWYFARKVKIEKVEVSKETTIIEGKDMLTMGFMLSISGLYVLAKNYGLRVFISNLGGLEQVGLYSAGFAIINTYVGMVFTAMSTDYYPRLSAISQDNSKARQLVNEQAEVAILILAPIVAGFILFISWVVILLYSTRFLPINEMIQWAALGMFFKASSWAVAFLFLAKGDSKVFLGNELFGGTITLIFHVLGYYFGGLTGMGIGFLLGYAYYTGQVIFLTKRKYEFSYNHEFIKVFLIQFFLAMVCFLAAMLVPKPWSYAAGIPFLLVSFVFSYRELDKRIGIKQIVERFTKKNNER